MNTALLSSKSAVCKISQLANNYAVSFDDLVSFLVSTFLDLVTIHGHGRSYVLGSHADNDVRETRRPSISSNVPKTASKNASIDSRRSPVLRSVTDSGTAAMTNMLQSRDSSRSSWCQ